MAVVTIPNSDFESGNVEWTLNSPWTITNAGDAFTGTWSAQFNTGFSGYAIFLSEDYIPMGPGQTITASCMCQQGATDAGLLGLNLILYFYDAAQNWLGAAQGNVVNNAAGGAWLQSSATASSPANTAFVRIGAAGNRIGQNLPAWVDTFVWNLEYNRSVLITSPPSGSTFNQGQVVSFQSSIAGTSPPIQSVEYFDGVTSLGSSTTAPYIVNTSTLATGARSITAVATASDGTTTFTSPAITVNVSAVTPTVREFKASNSYTYLVAENFSGLTANMPSTALVTGVELVLDYDLNALIRSKDIGVSDPTLANPQVAFDITNDAVLEAVLMQKNESSYTITGSGITQTIPLLRSDFSIVEEGTSENKKWSVMEATSLTATIGSDDTLFGLTPIAASDFATRSVGFRFYPVMGVKPAYADSGDCCFRYLLNKLRLRVYFDAGSAEYYFASPDKTDVIKGTLVSSYVDSGNFQTGDAAGVLQLSDSLEVMDGDQTYIGGDWTIHAAYPPTDANQIGTVQERETVDGVGMAYNGLPGQTETQLNRSRYVFITANFFGDKTLDSIYGANGVGRGFAFNGSDFYKIQTQPDVEKDKPRHVAAHHTHLALGYDDGRVDISVVGQPWNFDGAQGASSWATGDPVTGLLPLSGTILGVFGSKSIAGISGTTVDNFATQTISPNIGAIEYTITDMGYPVYANAYGIYTLSQTQQYGDYLGSPMSQDISPWLRPRLVRKITSDKEVVVAWPVRHKNQYRLAFSDGYVLTMTMNGQQAVPTFSFQKYYYEPEEGAEGLTLYEYPALVPLAVSSELDESGQERIHIADTPALPEPVPESPEVVVWSELTGSSGIVLRKGESFNSEVEGLDLVTVVGYYTPSINYNYPPSQDPMPVNLDDYTFNPTTFTLEDDGSDNLVNFGPDIPQDNDYYICSIVLPDDSTILGALINSGGA